MPFSNSDTVPIEVENLIPSYSKSVFFKLSNVFKNRTTFSILLWLYENEIGLNVEDVIAGFNISRASAFRYCRMLADAKVADTIWDVKEKDIRAYARNRFVISEYGKRLIDTLFTLEKTTGPVEITDLEDQKEWSLRNQVSAKLEERLSGRLEDYVHTKRFEDLIFKLMSKEYRKIRDRNVYITWAREGANAVIVWNQDKTDVIRCNIAVAEWPEPVIIGLLSHELSHIALGAKLHKEHQADEDVIARGLGHFLALERVFTNKYSDHVLKEGEDRYLGYISIRSRLKPQQVEQLYSLMSEHDIVIDVDKK